MFDPTVNPQLPCSTEGHTALFTLERQAAGGAPSRARTWILLHIVLEVTIEINDARPFNGIRLRKLPVQSRILIRALYVSKNVRQCTVQDSEVESYKTHPGQALSVYAPCLQQTINGGLYPPVPVWTCTSNDVSVHSNLLIEPRHGDTLANLLSVCDHTSGHRKCAAIASCTHDSSDASRPQQRLTIHAHYRSILRRQGRILVQLSSSA